MNFWILVVGMYIGMLVMAALVLLMPDPDKTSMLERLKKKRYKKLHKDEIQAEKREKKVQKKINRKVNWYFRRLKKSYARGDDFEVILESESVNCPLDTMVKLIKAEMHRFGLPYVKIEYNRVYREHAIVYWTDK